MIFLMAARYWLTGRVWRFARHPTLFPKMRPLAFLTLLIIATMSHGFKQLDNREPKLVADNVIERLRGGVQRLAGEIGERNVFHPQALRDAADYIERVWTSQGYDVIRYEYELDGENWANLEVTRRGERRPGEIVLIGAHYDSVFGSPGANDNGSGVAAMLELSRRLATQRLERTVRFVAFVNEEPPFFKTSAMGSRVYVKMAQARGDNIRAMLCLETIGYYSDAPDSQHYPPFFNMFYPDKGNFIGIVSNFRSRALLKRATAAFRANSDFPVEHVTTFGFVPGVDWSDHWSFWRADVPAIMITDTALYRYPYYHTAGDTPEKVNYPQLARVVEGLLAVVKALAGMG